MQTIPTDGTKEVKPMIDQRKRKVSVSKKQRSSIVKIFSNQHNGPSSHILKAEVIEGLKESSSERLESLTGEELVVVMKTDESDTTEQEEQCASLNHSGVQTTATIPIPRTTMLLQSVIDTEKQKKISSSPIANGLKPLPKRLRGKQEKKKKSCKYTKKCFMKMFSALRCKERKRNTSRYDRRSTISDSGKKTVVHGTASGDSDYEDNMELDGALFRINFGYLKRIPLKAKFVSYQIRIAHRKRSIRFFQQIMDMCIIRHEEHEGNEDALGYGNWSGKWSRTVMAYYDEGFALELLYFYEWCQKEKHHVNITIQNRKALLRARHSELKITKENRIKAPAGCTIDIIDLPLPRDRDPIKKITLASTDLQRSVNYYGDCMQMLIKTERRESVTFCYAVDQVWLELKQYSTPKKDLDSLLTFTTPYDQLEQLADKFESSSKKFIQQLTVYPYTKKISIKVMLVADPDDHKIAFMDHESYSKLTEIDS